MEYKNHYYPIHGWVGIVMTLFTWAGNWTLLGTRTHLLFFPMWLGFILIVDGLVFKRKGHSLITRNGELFLALFLLSIPVWWVFEILNEITQNWSYSGKEFFHPLEYFILSSISFSTVIPVIFEMAEWVGSFSWINQLPRSPQFSGKRILPLYFVLGCLLFFGMFVRPDYFFPALWVAPFLILDPINAWKKRVSLIQHVQNGDWRLILALGLGALICGFFWEMWNFYSYPKWVYHIPYAGFIKIFEMPILGYLGYLPFSLALFAIFIMVFKINSLDNFFDLQILLDSRHYNS